MEINLEHFEHFSSYFNDQVKWPGKSPKAWVNSCLKDQVGPEVLNRLPETPVTIPELRSFCDDSANSLSACFISIMAWGGRNAVNARKSWRAHELWEPLLALCRQRSEKISRADLFDRFQKAEIPGLGPAYFTKLMYFMTEESEHNFILDQWTARSANLLTSIGDNKKGGVVCLQKSGKTMNVTRRNDGHHYKQYCELVEKLATMIGGADPFAVEQAMFSGGGNHRWRAYLKAHLDMTPTTPR